MSNHGHVIPNKDNSVFRCGGPVVCKVCALELASLTVEKREEYDARQEKLRNGSKS